jgi:hypothetical protein
VRQYLIRQHGIAASRLLARGYGKFQLLLPNDPTNALNRRVQFENPNYAATSIPALAGSPNTTITPAPRVSPFERNLRRWCKTMVCDNGRDSPFIEPGSPGRRSISSYRPVVVQRFGSDSGVIQQDPHHFCIRRLFTNLYTVIMLDAVP